MALGAWGAAEEAPVGAEPAGEDAPPSPSAPSLPAEQWTSRDTAKELARRLRAQSAAAKEWGKSVAALVTAIGSETRALASDLASKVEKLAALQADFQGRVAKARSAFEMQLAAAQEKKAPRRVMNVVAGASKECAKLRDRYVEPLRAKAETLQTERRQFSTLLIEFYEELEKRAADRYNAALALDEEVARGVNVDLVALQEFIDLVATYGGNATPLDDVLLPKQISLLRRWHPRTREEILSAGGAAAAADGAGNGTPAKREREAPVELHSPLFRAFSRTLDEPSEDAEDDGAGPGDVPDGRSEGSASDYDEREEGGEDGGSDGWSGMDTAAELRKELRPQVERALREELRAELEARVEAELRLELRSRVEEELRLKLEKDVRADVELAEKAALQMRMERSGFFKK